MNIDTTNAINTLALKELTSVLNVSDEDVNNHIVKIRNIFIENKNNKISETFLKIIEDKNIDDIMLGIILMALASDYYFSEYIDEEMKLDEN